MASEVAPYVCPYCGASFTKKATLNAHIHRLHREAREREAEEMKAAEKEAAEVMMEKKEEKTTPMRVSEASAEEFESFEPSSRRRRGETLSEKVYRMLLEGKVVKVEGSRGQLVALLANIGRLLYKEYRVDLKTAADYKLDAKRGILYIRLRKVPPR